MKTFTPESKKATTLLILGARAPVALELCRAFGSQGYRVILADSLHWPLARWSRFAARYVVLPPPAQAFVDFRSALQRLVEEEQVEHLIPTCEESFYVSYCRQDLACKVWTDKWQLLDQLHHKQRFLDLAKGFFAIPSTQSCTDFNDWENSKNYVFKPVYSRFGRQVLINRTAAECQPVRENPAAWIAQERIVGQEICVFSLWNEGHILAFVAYKPAIRLKNGAALVFEPYFHPAIYEAVDGLGKSLHYTGQLCFDVILKSGKPYVLECNPRSTSGIHLLGSALVPCFLQQIALAPLQNAPAKGLKTALWLSFQRQGFYPHHLLQDVVFDRQDLVPFFGQVCSVLELVYLALRRRSSITRVSTWDIEWNGPPVE
jgi:ATP-grasp domain